MGETYNGVIDEWDGFVERRNGGRRKRELKVLHTSSCANHSDEPLRAKIVFSRGFHDF